MKLIIYFKYLRFPLKAAEWELNPAPYVHFCVNS